MRIKASMIKILLHGLTGPVEEKTYTDNMMALGMNDDEWIASILSYVRYDIGQSDRRFPGTPSNEFITRILVQPEEVKKIREQTLGRSKPWTWIELEKEEPVQKIK